MSWANVLRQERDATESSHAFTTSADVVGPATLAVSALVDYNTATITGISVGGDAGTLVGRANNGAAGNDAMQRYWHVADGDTLAAGTTVTVTCDSDYQAVSVWADAVDGLLVPVNRVVRNLSSATSHPLPVRHPDSVECHAWFGVFSHGVTLSMSGFTATATYVGSGTKSNACVGGHLTGSGQGSDTATVSHSGSHTGWAIGAAWIPALSAASKLASFAGSVPDGWTFDDPLSAATADYGTDRATVSLSDDARDSIHPGSTTDDGAGWQKTQADGDFDLAVQLGTDLHTIYGSGFEIAAVGSGTDRVRASVYSLDSSGVVNSYDNVCVADYCASAVSGTVVAASGTNTVGTYWYAGGPTWLRLKRSGDDWTFYGSADGWIWVKIRSWTAAITVSAIRLAALNTDPSSRGAGYPTAMDVSVVDVWDCSAGTDCRPEATTTSQVDAQTTTFAGGALPSWLSSTTANSGAVTFPEGGGCQLAHAAATDNSYAAIYSSQTPSRNQGLLVKHHLGTVNADSTPYLMPAVGAHGTSDLDQYAPTGGSCYVVEVEATPNFPNPGHRHVRRTQQTDPTHFTATRPGGDGGETSYTHLDEESVPLNTQTYWERLEVLADDGLVRYRRWLDGDTEPDDWDYVAADRVNAAAGVQSLAWSHNDGVSETAATDTVVIDSLTVYDLQAPAPPSGDAAGTVSWAGGAAGTRTSAGSADGSLSWAGGATGSRASSGSASGATAWAGSATGTTTKSGSASAALAWTGDADGATAKSGTATGGFAFEGSASGSTTKSGTVSGALDWAGAASGRAPTVGGKHGHATGALAWAGSASGTRASSGTVSGSLAWAGSTTGTTARSGTAAGSLAWAGATPGTTDRQGTAGGTLTWAGAASGSAPSVGAKSGTAAGTLTWLGSASGITDHSGSVAGHLAWVGHAVSPSTAPHPGDVTLTITPTGSAGLEVAATGAAGLVLAATGSVSLTIT